MNSTSVQDDDRDRGAIFGWIYLGIISAVFLAIALWAYNGADSDGTATVITGSPRTTTTVAAPAAVGAVVDAEVDRSFVTLTGSVPDEGARAQLVNIAEDHFGNGNVTDELVIDPDVDLVSGVINVSGVAESEDEARALQANADADLSLAAGEFELDVVAPQFEAAMIDLDVTELPVLITGTVPDEAARNLLIESAEATYGAGNVDASAVEIASGLTMDGAMISISGLTAPGSTQTSDLADTLGVDFRTAIVSDESEIDVSDQALTDFEQELADILELRPILFASGTSTITEEGQANLIEIAAKIEALPDREVEIVGHTDNTGGDTVNQTLSENRALAVKEALVELGVEESRLTTRGAGSSEPKVDNDTAANRALNRRIEFNFERG